jgi:hypothetical protein
LQILQVSIIYLYFCLIFIAYSCIGIESKKDGLSIVGSANPQIQIVDNEHEAILVSAEKEPEKGIKYFSTLNKNICLDF